MTDVEMNKLRAKVGLPPLKPYVPYNERCDLAASELTKEKRQEFMDHLTKGHKNLGQAQEAAGISFEAALGIMNRQIKTGFYLETEVA